MSDDTLPAEDNIVNDAATINSQDSPSGKADQAVSDDKTVASAPADEADEDDDDEEEEEEAETIPITADTVPASHPDAGKLEEALPEDSQPIIAKAAEDAGLGTSVGAGLAELVQAQDEGDQADEDEQSEAQREEQREESGTQESTTTPTTDAQPLNVEQQAETSASTSSSDASTSSSKVYSLLGKNLKLNSAEDAQPYCDELEAIEGLEEVHLGGNTLGQGACEAFARALQRSRSTLRVFNGADIFTGRLITEIPASLRALCNGLIEHEKLQVVDLSDNAFGGRCADAMTRLFSENHAIEVIRLQNNGLGISGGKIIAAALEAAADRLQAAGRSSALRIVTIGRNRLENGSAPDLARALARHGSAIEEVRVPQNGIRMQGIEELCRQLAAHCPNLRSLDVQDNTLVQRGSRALAAAIPAWPHLESLNLSDSLVRSTGARWIFDALGKHATGLKTLLLQYCELNRDAIVALADVLESSLHSLKHVELHGNWIEEDDEAVERIKAAIQSAGGDVDELGLDELEPEAEEEEEAEEDYEDFDEEEEEAALEEEEQEEAQVPAVTPSTVAFDPSAESNATVAEQPGKAVIQETSVADDASEKEGKEVLQQAADSTTDAIGALESAVGAITLQDGAEGVSDRDVAGAVAEDIQADKIEDSQDLSSNARGEVALDSTPSAEVQTALSNGEAMEDVQADVKPEGDEKSLAATGSVAAADDDKDVVEGSVPEAANAATSDSILAPQSEEPDDRAGLDAAAGAVAAIPTGVLDTTANLASASGDVIKDTVEDKVDDVSPLLTKGPPVDEAATAAGAPFQDLSTDAADHDKGAAETAAAKLNSALESAKATVPDALGREEQPAVSGQAISLGDADDVVQPDAVTAGADTGAPSQDADHKGEAGSKRTSILDSIESAADSVFPAPSGLVSSSEHGGISGEESGTSALPTPALERDLMAESAGESKATQEAIPLQGEDVAAPKIEARRGFILESIKSASQSVIPAASNLLGQRGHGGVSGEGLDTSALPTPAVERDLVDGAVAPEGGVEAEHAEQDQRRAPGASILDTIKSATQAVLPAAAGSSLIAGGARSGHGAVSGEGLDTSALPTPAAERDLVEAGPSTSAGPSTTSSAAPPPPSSYEVGDKDKEAARPGTATGRASTGRKLPSSESQMIRQIAEALSDELPQARQRRQGHGRINSIDLSGELYIDGAMSPSRFAHLERDEDDDEAARAGGRGGVAGRMRAALGAVWELMR